MKKLKLAALFHDFGKLVQRADGPHLKHEEKVIEYLKEIEFKDELFDRETESIILKHHKREKNKYMPLENVDQKLCDLLIKADHADAEQRGKKQDSAKIYKNGLKLFVETMTEENNKEIIFPLKNYFQEISLKDFPNKLENLYNQSYDNLSKPYNDLFGKKQGNRKIFSWINQKADFETRYKNYLDEKRTVFFL